MLVLNSQSAYMSKNLIPHSYLIDSLAKYRFFFPAKDFEGFASKSTNIQCCCWDILYQSAFHSIIANLSSFTKSYQSFLLILQVLKFYKDMSRKQKIALFPLG